MLHAELTKAIEIAFKDLIPPPIKLVECVSILGLSAPTLRKLLLEGKNSSSPEIVMKYPESSTSIKESRLHMIFTDLSVTLQTTYKPPQMFSTTFTESGGDFTHAHCLILHERISPQIIERSKSRVDTKSYILDLDKHAEQAQFKYAPVVICLNSKSMFTDVFRRILQVLYISLVRTAMDEMEGGLLGSLDFMRSVNFLVHQTIIPPFNMHSSIKLSNFSIDIPVEDYSGLLHYESCVPILLSLVDIKSIIRCWEAVLINKHLFLVCSNSYILFLVFEAFKQLIFPMNWNLNIIPILSPQLREYMGSIPPIMIGINSKTVEGGSISPKDKDDVVLNIDTGDLQTHKDSINAYLCDCRYKIMYNKLQLLKVYYNITPDNVVGLSLYSLEDDIFDPEFLAEAKLMMELSDRDIKEQALAKLVKTTFFELFLKISNLKDFMSYNSSMNEYVFNSEAFLAQTGECQNECKMGNFWSVIIDNSMTFQIFLDYYKRQDNSFFKRFYNILKSMKGIKDHNLEKIEYVLTPQLTTEQLLEAFIVCRGKAKTATAAERFQNKTFDLLCKNFAEALHKRVVVDVAYGSKEITIQYFEILKLKEIHELNLFYGENGLVRVSKVLFFVSTEMENFSENLIKTHVQPLTRWDEIVVDLLFKLKMSEDSWDLEYLSSALITLNKLNPKALPKHYCALVLSKIYTTNESMIIKFQSVGGELRKILNSLNPSSNVARATSISSKKEMKLNNN